MSHPLVNIMMPVYNGMPLLKASIQSIINQTYPHWQCIICDDGSTDGTWEYLQTLLESTICTDVEEINKTVFCGEATGLSPDAVVNPKMGCYVDGGLTMGARSQSQTDIHSTKSDSENNSSRFFSGFCQNINEGASFIVLRNETNQGRGFTRQRILEACTAPYLCMLDAGDLMHPDRLQKQVEYLESHPDVGLCSTAMLSFGTHTDALIYRSSGATPDSIMTYDGIHLCCFAPSMFRNPLKPSNPQTLKPLDQAKPLTQASALELSEAFDPAKPLTQASAFEPSEALDPAKPLTQASAFEPSEALEPLNRPQDIEPQHPRVAFSPSLRVCEDQPFLRQYLAHNPRYYCMSQPLYFYSEFDSSSRAKARCAYRQNILIYFREHMYRQSLISFLKYLYSIFVYPFYTDEQMVLRRSGREVTESERSDFDRYARPIL